MAQAHLCKDCRYYYAYYVINNTRFEKRSNGWCQQRNILLCDKLDTCKYWRSGRTKQEDARAMARTYIELAAKNICELTQIFYENAEEPTE